MIVVGAGPTGLALACGLLSSGVAVRVVDQADGPATTSRALGLQPRGAEVLDRIGALDGLPERAIGIRRVVIHSDGGRVAELDVGRVTRLVRRPGLLVSQAEVEAGLRRRLAELGGRVEWGTRAEGVRPDGALRLGGAPARADWVVGCDGAHSAVRKSVGIGFPGAPLVEGFALADVRAELPLPRDAVAVWLGGEGLFAAFPLPGGVWRFMAPAPGVTPAGVPEVIARLARERAGLPASAITGWGWTSAFRVHRRLADTYRRGRVLLAGDAAHIHSPLGGQGMNTGLGDAENLAWRLALVASGRADESLVDGYGRERGPVAADVLESTSGLTRLVLGGSAGARLLRDRVLLPLVGLPRVGGLLWERASQLGLSYARSPLGPRPRVGDRVADLAGPNGFRWTLAAPEGPAGAACAAVARRHLGEVATARAPRCLLTRPDAHLAWRGAPDPAALDAALSAMLGA